ncbi:ABC transporter permease [Micromonospora sp. NPDC003776]
MTAPATVDGLFDTPDARADKAGALYACRTFAWRGLLKLKNVPDQLGTAVIFPIVLTLVFTYLLGGAIAGSPRQYLQFFLPGVIVIVLVSSSWNSALSLNRDIATGMFDRVRSSAIWRPSVIVGALAADVFRYLLTSVVVLLVGMLLGFRPHGGLSGVVLALLFLQLFAFSVAWVWMLFAVLIRQPEALQGLLYPLQFLLLFGSNALAPAQTMPGWLAAVVKANPVSHANTVVRGLLQGTATSGQVGSALLYCAVLIVVFGVPTALLYSRKQR